MWRKISLLALLCSFLFCSLSVAQVPEEAYYLISGQELARLQEISVLLEQPSIAQSQQLQTLRTLLATQTKQIAKLQAYSTTSLQEVEQAKTSQEKSGASLTGYSSAVNTEVQAETKKRLEAEWWKKLFGSIAAVESTLIALALVLRFVFHIKL